MQAKYIMIMYLFTCMFSVDLLMCIKSPVKEIKCCDKYNI